MYAAAPTLVTLLPVGNLPDTIPLQPDGRVVAAAVGTAFLIALVITAIPAWLATRRASLQLGTDCSVTRATNRSARVLLVLQVAATLVLAFGCSLLVRSLVALETVDCGYAARNVLSMRLTSTAGGYTALNQPAYYPDLVARVSALPQVRSVGMARYFGTLPNERGRYGPVSGGLARDRRSPPRSSSTRLPGFLAPSAFPC